jgi:hypothetical protein
LKDAEGGFAAEAAEKIDSTAKSAKQVYISRQGRQERQETAILKDGSSVAHV